MKIQVITDKGNFEYPLGFADKDHVHLNSMTFSRQGSEGGEIGEEQVIELVKEAIETGAKLIVKYEKVTITIE